MSKLSIRTACADDAAILSSIEAECFTDPWNGASFETLMKNPASLFVIAEQNGVPVAYAAALVIVDECEILKVAVTAACRRCGIGRRLVEHILDVCRSRDVSSVYLEHRESNSAAAALYESFAFEKYDVRKKYYNSPTEDAILRKLTL